MIISIHYRFYNFILNKRYINYKLNELVSLNIFIYIYYYQKNIGIK